MPENGRERGIRRPEKLLAGGARELRLSDSHLTKTSPVKRAFWEKGARGREGLN